MKKFILFLVVLVSACSSEVTSSHEASERITYFKDSKTGLCFAQITSLTNGGLYVTSIATVDCEKVEKYLVK